MSQRFFAIILVLAIVIFVLLKIVIPMWNFMLRADLAISLYDMLKNILKESKLKFNLESIQYGIQVHLKHMKNLKEFLQML